METNQMPAPVIERRAEDISAGGNHRTFSDREVSAPAILYHRSEAISPKNLIGLRGDYGNLPVRLSLGDEKPTEWYPLYIVDERSKRRVHGFVDGVANIVGDRSRRGYLQPTTLSIVDAAVPGVLDELVSKYNPLPLTFSRAEAVGSDILDVGFPPQLSSQAVLRNLAIFFERLGNYKPTGKDFRYTILREIGLR